MVSSLNFFIARSVLSAGSAQNLIALHDPTDRSILRVRRAETGLVAPSREPLSIFGYRVASEAMKRLKFAPDNLVSLAAMLGERGIDLFGDLKPLLASWIAEGESAALRLNGRFVVIVEMPVVSPGGEQRDGLDHRAFITAQAVGDIAVALGIAEESLGHGKVGYVMKVLGVVDQAALAAIKVQTAEVYLEFEPDLAAKLAGRNAPDTRKAVLVGAGAIGSHLADCLAREGRFLWTVIDDDKLLPHNLARHVAGNNDVTRRKAQILADHINGTFMSAPQATAIAANVFADGQDGTSIEGALRQADLIIDATASIVAARHISDHATVARRTSVFFNPAGEAVVLLAEPAGRALTLRDLEAQYVGFVLRKVSLAEHLGKEAETVAYTGACRALTNRIPQSRAAVLSGLAALGLSAAVDADAGVISIWTLQPGGNVAVETIAPESVIRFRAGAWEITVDTGLLRRIYEMREARVPVETGGILFGLVDFPAKRIHIVDASPAPPDSLERRSEFVRGVEGVDALMESVRQRTAGQVRYVGEWHSHPPCASARPSATDGRQIDWLAALMGMDSMPALMLIAAKRELAVIFVHERAEQLPQDRAA
jgi:integrative and conjugative element protein (TIGR02256 family)